MYKGEVKGFVTKIQKLYDEAMDNIEDENNAAALEIAKKAEFEVTGATRLL